MKNHDKRYIDGRWVVPHGTGSFEVRSASTEEIIGTVPAGDAEDAARAVEAAAKAFPSEQAGSARSCPRRSASACAATSGRESRRAPSSSSAAPSLPRG